MKVVLTQDVKGLGKKFEVVEASEGYARNYLIPRKLAKLADNKTVSESVAKNQAIQFKKATDKQKAQQDKKLMESKNIEFTRKVGQNDKLFGSVTEKEIAEEVEKMFKFKLDKKKVNLNEAIKSPGSYYASIKLYDGVVAKLKVVVRGM